MTSVDTAELLHADRVVREPGKPAVRHTSEHVGAGRLEGASLVEVETAAAMRGGMRQVSTIVLRLRAGHRAEGQQHSAHEAEYRAHILHNGRDVLRYSLYQDPDGSHGFPGRQAGASYGITLSERFVVDATADAPAEVHVRYEGQIHVKNAGQVRFKGTLVLLGSGKIRPGRPHLEGPDGRATFTAGCVTIGVW